MKIVLVTGGFDPLHSGHIKYFEEAKKLGDQLIIGLNSDAWLTRKKGRPFMKWEDRLAVVRNIRGVNWTVQFDDSDGTAKDAIRKVRLNYPNDTIVFANGGDRTKDNIPEKDIKDDNLEFVFGVGGENKMNSSSWILEEWKSPKTARPWGYYRVLHEVPGMKVKELTVDPGCSLSMQRHTHRAEYWIVSYGACVVNSMMPGGYALPPTLLKEHLEFKVPVGEWHQLTNPYKVPCKIPCAIVSRIPDKTPYNMSTKIP
jgi:cytidyltransferase-like protein